MKQRQKKREEEKALFWKKTNEFFQRNSTILLVSASAIYLIFSFFTFNLRISEGGDDSTYIIRALSLLEEGKFPEYQGPLYPVMLAGFISLFGSSVEILKLSSWIFLSVAIFIFYKTFYNRVSFVTLWGTVFALIVNHHLLYFGSQTYTEAFFMMLQGVFLWYMFYTTEHPTDTKNNLRQTFILALLIFSLSLTRTVAIAVLPAIIVYFIIGRKYRTAIFTTLFFVLLAALFVGLKTYLTDNPITGSDQAGTLMLKNPYNHSDGQETFGGFLSRFAGNSSIYLSKYFPILTGFKPAMSLSKQPIVAIFLYLWFFAGLIRFYKRNPFLFFTGLYLIFLLGATFFVLQTLWDQIRLIIPFFPLMVIFLLETVVSYTSESKFAWKQKVPIVFISLSILFTTAQTFKQTDFSAIFKNLSGDRYYGYTPDWQNYLKMAAYTASELPENSYVACRKPNMARLYANGREFYGIYRFDTEDPDSLFNQLYKRNVTHIMVGSLRKNPRYRTGEIINTIHRYVSIIADEYPNSFILKKKTGSDEPVWLFEIDYNHWLQENPELKQSKTK